ncbi:leucine-rich repeat and calponin homology domain-containing protein 1-like [Archocentrus centrarchus]|uniref:leucine-rich repeat and calponin homology domain-containing protein 1-like n=1 Tax=Archocentrus centrarchus TaxID=63155 RepID=UPI0011EA07A2|nr:leucine-rich repeat and calponin homology domain-containing protein 1-like [Archocentrus centrarchus]
MDGVVLCHLANHIRPRSVASIHVPSPAVPKLNMAKCRRNVENFLDACRKIGVPQTDCTCRLELIPTHRKGELQKHMFPEWRRSPLQSRTTSICSFLLCKVLRRKRKP